jgi:hypothetical protein
LKYFCGAEGAKCANPIILLGEVAEINLTAPMDTKLVSNLSRNKIVPVTRGLSEEGALAKCADGQLHYIQKILDSNRDEFECEGCTIVRPFRVFDEASSLDALGSGITRRSNIPTADQLTIPDMGNPEIKYRIFDGTLKGGDSCSGDDPDKSYCASVGFRTDNDPEFMSQAD